MIEIGRVIDDRYQILKEIDRGGMSIVYLADDSRLKKSVVLKDIRKGNNINNEILLMCLKEEADLLSSLDHPNLPKIYDIIEGFDHIYVVMDYIEGESLKKKLDSNGGKGLPAKQVVEWAKQLADVMDYLHNRKPSPIIYRDMKPHNIMLTPEGKIKLIDFGTAIRSNDSGNNLNFGTNTYAAPEQLKSSITNEQTDIYSLGVTLYQLVTGLTKKGDRKLKPIRQVDSTLPEGLEKIISKCMAENPSERYTSCSKLLRDLNNIEKLNQDYHKKVIKRIIPFCISVSIFIASCSTAIYSKSMSNSNNLSQYKELLNEASTELIDGNKTKAIEILDKAITQVDGSRAEAYTKIIDVYISMDDINGGIDKVESYINDKYKKVDENDQVLFKLGMTYLDTKNYPMALKYFQQVNKKRIPDVQYYKILANSMSSMNMDYVAFEKELDDFSMFVDGLPNDEKKLMNYNTLANIYSSYKSQLKKSNETIIEIVNKAYSVLDNISDIELEIKYEVEFSQKLAQAYHSLGSNDRDVQTANNYFNKALVIYNELLDMDVTNRETILIKIGDIYTEMKDYNLAIEQYKLTINQIPNSIKAYCKLVNTLIDVQQNANTRNYSEAQSYYNTVSGISGVGDNDDYKKLKRRITNLQL